jgi:hypothetical protein
LLFTDGRFFVSLLRPADDAGVAGVDTLKTLGENSTGAQSAAGRCVVRSAALVRAATLALCMWPL